MDVTGLFARILLPSPLERLDDAAAARGAAEARVVGTLIAIAVDVGVVFGLRVPAIRRDVLTSFGVVNISLLAVSLLCAWTVRRRNGVGARPFEIASSVIEATTATIFVQLTGSVSSYFLLAAPMLVLIARVGGSYAGAIACALTAVVAHASVVALEIAGKLPVSPLFVEPIAGTYLLPVYKIAVVGSTSSMIFFAFAVGNWTVRRLAEQEHALAGARADLAKMRAEALLAQRDRDVVVLNGELRRQIGGRAEALAGALGRLVSVSETRSHLAPGELIAERYRVLRLLGEGGMGAVYEVERIADGRHLALKVLAGEHSGLTLARFAREAQVLARFDHPNLVGVADVDVDPTGLFFVVMELVEGMSLADERIARGDVEWARQILRQLATGLHMLHAHGIVHRDLKPANVLLSRNEGGVTTVKIADFGIARLGAEISGEDDTLPAARPAAIDSALTSTGVLMGTPAYIAPELARGTKDAQPSSDIFAFGVIAYELLTGAYPFRQPPVFAPIDRACERPPLSPDLPAWCPALIDCCLLPDPTKRPTAAELEVTLTRENRSA